MYSDMSMCSMARSSSNGNSAAPAPSSVFPTLWCRDNRNEPMGRLGSEARRPAAPHRIRTRASELRPAPPQKPQRYLQSSARAWPPRFQHLRDSNARPFETPRATSSSSTSCFSMRPVFCTPSSFSRVTVASCFSRVIQLAVTDLRTPCSGRLPAWRAVRRPWPARSGSSVGMR